VALWRPAESILFDAWKQRRQLGVLERLSCGGVRLVTDDS